MKTNLIFKRQQTIDGVLKTITRIVPVDLPMINSGDGWILSGHTDTIEACDDVYIHRVAPPVNEPAALPTTEEKFPEEDVKKFESDVKGTAKLVRTKGVIKIVARRGKLTYNQTTPNSVCIDDNTKNQFFKHCRYHGDTFVFYAGESAYAIWNQFIDKEYTQQKERYIKRMENN